MTETHPAENPRIVVTENGPYDVYGNVPLVQKTQAVSEHGEPLTWVKGPDLRTPEMIAEGYYRVCRCGQSKNKPFCDDTHLTCEFNGTETAVTGPSAGRAVSYKNGPRLYVKRDSALCMDSGFCGFSDAGLQKLISESADTKLRSLVIAMVERCPSGALTYHLAENAPDIEPDLPVQIAITTEITSEGPIPGPLWVTGGIPIERSDGQPFETRNRATLCVCGLSGSKPLCDGTHRGMEEMELRDRKSNGGLITL